MPGSGARATFQDDTLQSSDDGSANQNCFVENRRELMEHRLASLESTLLPAEAAVQPLLKSVQAMVQRLNEIQDRSLAEFFEKCASPGVAR